MFNRKEAKPKCEKCRSRFVYVTREEIVCRNCGHRKKRELEEKQNA